MNHIPDYSGGTVTDSHRVPLPNPNMFILMFSIKELSKSQNKKLMGNHFSAFE